MNPLVLLIGGFFVLVAFRVNIGFALIVLKNSEIRASRISCENL